MPKPPYRNGTPSRNGSRPGSLFAGREARIEAVHARRKTAAGTLRNLDTEGVAVTPAPEIAAAEIGIDGYETTDADDTASFADVAKKVGSVRWLVPRFVPYGMLTGVVAEPKVGKSAFALGALGRPVLTGERWFTGAPGPEPGPLVYGDTERSAAVNLERARNWGLPLDRIKVPFPDDPLTPICLENPEHLARLRAVVCRYKARLVIVDSFRGAHDGDENNSRIVKPLRDLAGIAEETGAAVVLIHHAKKLSFGEDMTINAGRGSNAFLAAVRCQIVIDRPDPKGEWRRMQVLGENLGIAPPPVGFKITTPGLVFGPAPERPRRQTEKGDAGEWLRQRMTPGQTYKSSELIAEARDKGYAERTLRKAADDLNVTRSQVREGGHIAEWLWTLPSPSPEGKS